MKYKIWISFDEINYSWIIIENCKVINKDATKEDILKIPTKPVYYNKTNICPICLELKEVTDKSILYPKNVGRGYKTGQWVCQSHINEESTKYKIYVSTDGVNFFWVLSHNKKLIKDFTKEDLEYARFKKYNDKNICPICKEENNITDYSILYPGNAEHNIDKNGKRTNEWVCRSHHNRNYNRYNPNSWNNIEKSFRDRRTGNLREPSHLLGDTCEELTKECLGVKRLSVEHDKYSQLPFDHSPIPTGISVEIGGKLEDLSGKIPETKGSHYHHAEGYWHANIRNKDFDILILYCVSEDNKTIERIYIIPKDKIKTGVWIYKNPSRGIQWYKEYKVTDEYIIRMSNVFWGELNEQ